MNEVTEASATERLERAVRTLDTETVAPLGLQHRNYLDGLRGLAALYIVFHHCFLQVFTNPKVDLANVPFSWKGLYLLSRGHDAVSLFIVLSGFCLMLPVSGNGLKLRGSPSVFLRKRFVRIVPTYLVALLISYLLIIVCIGQRTGTHWDVALPVTDFGILTHLLLIQDAFASSSPQINHAMWSISVEWRIYFFFPLIVFAWQRYGLKRIFLVVTGLTLFLFGLLGFFPLMFNRLMVHYLLLFMFGMIGADMVTRIQIYPTWVSIAKNWVILGSVALLCGAVNKILWLPTISEDLFIGIACMSAMVYTSLLPNSQISTFLSWKPIRSLGLMGYSLYLIHAPLLQIVQQYFLHSVGGPPIPTLLALFAVGVPFSVFCAYLFYLAVEKPFVRLTQSIGKSTLA